MAVSLASGAAPIFLGSPQPTSDADTAGQITAYNNSTGTFNTLSMQALVHRIYQFDPTAYWQGSGGADDTKTERITMGLYKGVAQATVSLDFVALLGHNLDNFLIEYCADYTPGVSGAEGTGTWATFVNVTGQAGADYLYQKAVAVSANGLRLTMTTTSPASQQKKLGNFIAGLVQVQLSNPPSKIVPTPKRTRLDVDMADKTIDTTYFGWSDNPFTPLLTIDMLFEHLNVYSAGDKAALDALFVAGLAFVVLTEPGDVKRAVYLCLFDQVSYVPVYQQSWKGGGYRAPFKLIQVGWI